MKKIIIETLERDIDINGSIGDVIAKLEKYQVTYTEWVLFLELDQYYDSFEIKLLGERMETDEEQQLRLASEKEQIRLKEERKAKRLAKQQGKTTNRIKELEEELAKLKGNA